MPARSLIPRRTLFDNPTFFGPKLSPDGRWLSWLAPVDGVLNVWLAPTDDIAAGRPVTRTRGRPISWQDWSPDGRSLMFLNDENGDENFHLFVVDPHTCALRDLTPFAAARTELALWSYVVPGKVAVRLNDRDRRWFDVFALDLKTGEHSLVWENRQEFGYVGLDWHLKPKLAVSNAPDGGARLWRIDGEHASHWRDVDFESRQMTFPIFFDIAGKHLYMLSNIGRDKSALVAVDWATGDERVLFEDQRADVTQVIFDYRTFEPQAACVDPGQQQWIPLSPEVEPDLALIEAELSNRTFTVQSQSDDSRRWIVTSYSAEQPATYHLLDRDSGTLTELFNARPDLKPYRLAPMHVVNGRSRDGLTLVSYLTLPAEIESERPPEPLPMVLLVHGGPWARDIYGYRGDHQWLADRGYAVLSVNYRGSTGFGKAFVAASEKEHARKIHDDLIDMVEWAIGEGIARRDKVAIFGTSYGGYAAFVAATFTPDVFCCAVPIVGISNLQTLLESMPPYWAGFDVFMYRSYGDPSTEEGRKLLAERSPLHKVDNIKKPMLIFHGANDVRCKIIESDAIVAAMQAKHIPVSYVVYPDEGHGFQKPPNRLSFTAIAEAFLARHLGGACEPPGRDLDGSSHEIRAGGDLLMDISAD